MRQSTTQIGVAKCSPKTKPKKQQPQNTFRYINMDTDVHILVCVEGICSLDSGMQSQTAFL